MKRRIRWLLMCCLLVLMLPFTVYASTAEVATGTCGENLTWVLDDEGTLTISGTGPMDEFGEQWSHAAADVPWGDYSEDIITVVIEDGVTYIDNFAFYGYGNLQKVTIPASVTSVGWYHSGGGAGAYNGAFFGCDNLNSIGPIGSGCDLEFGWTETIPSGAFYGIPNVNKIIMPETITSIGDRAFSGFFGSPAGSITSAGPIGSGCDYEFGWTTEIADGAFRYLTKLKSVTIPETVTGIGAYAFYNCTALTEVHIPETVTTIEDYAFSYCSNISELALPGNLKAIGAGAFSNMTSVGNFDLPDSLETLGRGAFSYCSSLKSIVIPETVTTLVDSLFFYCTSLENVILPDTMTTIEGSAFQSCASLQTISLPQNLTTLEGWAFYNMTGLKTIVIPGSVRTIGDYTFAGCTALEKVVLGEGITSIGKNAFNSCLALKKIVLPETLNTVTAGIWSPVAQNITSAGPIGSGCDLEFGWTKSIPGGVFANLTKLKKLTIPASVTKMNYSSLSGLTGITCVGPIGSGCDLEYGWTEELPEYAFAQLTNATQIIWPDETGGDGIQRIGSNAFSHWESLEKIVIPESVTEIGSDAFSYCTNLSYVAIRGSVETLPNDLFSVDTALEDVVLPASVTEINYGAFNYCSVLKNVFFEGTKEMWDAIVIQEENDALISDNVTIHYGYEAVYLEDIVYFEAWRANCAYLLSPDGAAEYQTKSGVTDRAFLDNPTALLGTYAVATFQKINNVPYLKNLTEVESKSGSVEAADRYQIVINGKTFQTPIDLDAPEQYRDKFVIYQAYKDKLMGISVLEFRDYLDNRNILINGSGEAFAVYQGKAYQRIKYSVNGREEIVLSDDKGIFMVDLGSFRIASIQEVPVEIIQVGNVALDPFLVLTPMVKVVPFAFTEKSKMTFAPEASLKLTKGGGINLMNWEAEASLIGIGAGVEGSGAIEMSLEHTRDGTQSFEVTASGEVGFEWGLSTGVYIGKTGEIETGNKDTKFTIAGMNAKNKDSVMHSYGLRFDDYTGSVEQNLVIGTFLWGEYLKVNPTEIMLYPLYQLAATKLYPGSGAVQLSGSEYAVSGSVGTDMGALKVNGNDIFSMVDASLKGTYTLSEMSGSDGHREKTTSLKTNQNVSLANLSPGDDIEITFGLLSRNFLSSDIEIKATQSSEGDSVQATSLDSSQLPVTFLLLGEYSERDYSTYTFKDEALETLMRNTSRFEEYLEGESYALTDQDLAKMASMLSGSDVPIAYARKTKQKALSSVPLTFGGGIGAFASVGATISYEKEISYQSANGVAVDDELYVTGTTTGVNQVIENELMEVPEFIEAVLTDVFVFVRDFIVTVGGHIADGIQTLGAWISGNNDSDKDRIVEISYVDAGAEYRASGYQISTVHTSATMSVSARTSDGGTAETRIRGTTLSKPYAVRVIDNSTGQEIADFGDDPLMLSIAYTAEELEALGLERDSDAVLGAAMYWYNEDRQMFEYIGGEGDPDEMFITAEICKPGQYVLAIDNCAPTLTTLDVSDLRRTPVITARVDDLLGMNAEKFVFKLDGAAKVDASNVDDYYHGRTGIFTYAVPEDEALTEGEHTISFTLEDVSGNSGTYEYSFYVDLTAPVISDISVEGDIAEGDVTEICGRVTDANNVTVYAAFSKLLPDGTWSEEVTTLMGALDDDFWGVAYEGNGSSIRFRIRAVDEAGNTSNSELIELHPKVDSLTISQERITLSVGESAQLSAEVKPELAAGRIRWSVDNEAVASVDENGIVRANGVGTACVTVTVDSGMTSVTASCSVTVNSVSLPTVNIGMARMILGNELKMQFAFNRDSIREGVDYVAIITKAYADGTDKTVVVPQSEWTTYGDYYLASFNGIAAKEMADDIRVKVVTVDGIEVSNEWVDSVEKYALRMLRKTDVPVTRAIYVEMLNYGAAAQVYFKYNTENLANAELTPEEKAYGLASVKLENNRVADENYEGSQLNLASSIQLRMQFKNINSSMYAVATFTNHLGKKVETRIDGSEFIHEGRMVVVNAIVAGDYKQDVTVTVYNTEGEAVATAVDSMASYIARMSSGNAIYDAVSKYCAAAHSYLHRND